MTDVREVSAKVIVDGYGCFHARSPETPDHLLKSKFVLE
jgi:hypothetical protein